MSFIVRSGCPIWKICQAVLHAKSALNLELAQASISLCAEDMDFGRMQNAPFRLDLTEARDPRLKMSRIEL
jgi:hypothetical protein